MIEKVKPEKLIPGQTYYLEYNLNPWQTAEPNYSYKVKGTFDRYEDTTYNNTIVKTVLFKDVKSVNDKSPARSLGVENSLLRFGVPPDGCAYTIYQPINSFPEKTTRSMIISPFGGRRHRKSRKSRKSRKTKSRKSRKTKSIRRS